MSADLAVHRVKQNAFATYGKLLSSRSAQEAVTLELPWRNNAHDVSCIPVTIDAQGNRVRAPYTAERYLSPDHGYVVFRLTDVPDRGYIELHAGCLPSDSRGCILLGSGFGFVQYSDGRKGDGITASKAAFGKFMADHPEQHFTVDVYDVPERIA
jgi:hypothetical protein